MQLPSASSPTWTEPLYTAAEMRLAEEAYEGTTLELMERAGAAVAEATLERYSDAQSFAVWCGTGANGGDGFVVARRLQDAGRAVEIRLVGSEEKTQGDTAANLARAHELDIPFTTEWSPVDVGIDALFGTGFSGVPRRDAAKNIEEMNALEAPIVSVDLPSGVDASTGEALGVAVESELTITFHGLKVGHAVAPGRFHAGAVHVADIGLSPAVTEHRRVTPGILGEVPRRGERDNKYSAGAVLVVGGSPGLTGAPSMAAEAALRAGAGIVTACVPEHLNVVFEQRLLEVMTRPCPTDETGCMGSDSADVILEASARAGAVALGPGLGRTKGTRELVHTLLERVELPIVVDADALWAITGHLEWVFEREAPTVLTPHAGELGRLIGRSSARVDARRVDAVQTAAADAGATVLLKGADTLVTSPNRGVLVSDLGNPGLATAGSGDVLTGIVAAFLAKGMAAQEGAAAAAAAAGVAAARAAEVRGSAGMIARDVIEALSPVLSAAGGKR